MQRVIDVCLSVPESTAQIVVILMVIGIMVSLYNLMESRRPFYCSHCNHCLAEKNRRERIATTEEDVVSCPLCRTRHRPGECPRDRESE